MTARKIVLVGPTAAGKTAVGIALAQRLKTEIVSADSMQVYRRMDIGTAKPTAAEQAQAQFHLIDVADPDDEWTLADFQRAGTAACEHLAARGKTPLIVGGTGLYVRALTTMLDIPAAPPDTQFRDKWRQFAAENGNAALHAEVGKVDPPAAARIHVNDVGRLIRALEVRQQTGKTLTALHAENQARAAQDDAALFGLHFADRAALYARIEARVDDMMAAGFLDEVQGLLNSGCGRGLKPMRSLGYKQLAACLHGELGLDDAVADIKRETRRFARRQLIWFRADRRIRWLDGAAKTPGSLADDIAALLEQAHTATTSGELART